MTRDNANKLLPIIEAYAEGKIIEFKDRGGTWREIASYAELDFIEAPERYRIKPEPKQTDAALAESHLSRLRQTDRANFERIILENLQFLDEGDVVEYLSTATLNNELLYRERKERLDKANEK
jgi:hypothetical protein